MDLKTAIYELLDLKGSLTKLEIVQELYIEYDITKGRNRTFQTIEEMVELKIIDLLPLNHNDLSWERRYALPDA